MSSLSLGFLGPPQIAVDGSEVRLGRRKAMALLAYLAVTARPHSRDALAELLYPGLDREQAYSDFRQALSALRSAIGVEWLETDRNDVALAGGRRLEVDTERFRRLVEESRNRTAGEVALGQAAELVRGPFLAGFYLKDCAEFEEWQAARAEGLLRDETEVLERLIDLCEERGERREAIDSCRRLLQLDPLEEGTYRRLMLLYALSGKRTAALTQYARCEAILRKGLDAEPSRETEELRERIASGRLKAPARQRARPGRTSLAERPFVGRARELERLVAAIRAARGGSARTVVVVGEAGIGKTRLLEEVAARAEDSAALVLWGRSYDDEGLPPYWPWRQVLAELAHRMSAASVRSWAGARAPLLGELLPDFAEQPPQPPPASATRDPESDRFRLADGVARVLHGASEERTLVLVLDDIHWADAGSLRLLEFVSRAPSGGHLAILAACRDVEAETAPLVVHTLGELGRERGFERIELGALSREELSALAEPSGLPRGLGPGLVDSLWERTRGNPLFAVELLRSSGAAEAEADRLDASGRPDGVPAGLRAVIRRRLVGLSPGCLGLLSAAALVSGDLPSDVLCWIGGLTAAELLPLVEEAVTARIVAPVPGYPALLRFTHPVVQDCLAAELTHARSAEAHARIAAALERRYGATKEQHAIEIAHHQDLAGPMVPGEELARYASLAGEQAMAGHDATLALRFFQAGLAAKGPAADDAETAWIRFGLARALVPVPYLILYYASADRSGTYPAFSALSAAYEYFERTGDMASALRVAQHPLVVMARSGLRDSLFRRALRLAPPGSAARARLSYYAGLDDFDSHPDYAVARSLFAQALAAATSFGDRSFEIKVSTDWALLAAAYAPPAEAAPALRRALGLVQGQDDPFTEFWLRVCAHHVAVLEGNLAECRNQAEILHTVADRLRSPYLFCLALLIQQEIAYVQGQWQQARVASDEAIGRGTDNQMARQHLGRRAAIESELGEVEASERYARRYIAAVERVGFGFNADTEQAIGLLAELYRSSRKPEYLALARSAANALVEPGHEEHLLRGHGPYTHAYKNLAFLAALEGDREQAERLRPHLARNSRNPLPGVDPIFAHVLGLLCATAGDADAAIERFEDALTLYRRLPAHPHLSWTCAAYAEALLERGGPGDRVRAARLVSEGLERAERLGMLPVAERLRALQSRVDAAGAQASSWMAGG